MGGRDGERKGWSDRQEGGKRKERKRSDVNKARWREGEEGRGGRRVSGCRSTVGGRGRVHRVNREAGGKNVRV